MESGGEILERVLNLSSNSEEEEQQPLVLKALTLSATPQDGMYRQFVILRDLSPLLRTLDQLIQKCSNLCSLNLSEVCDEDFLFTVRTYHVAIIFVDHLESFFFSISFLSLSRSPDIVRICGS